MNAPMTKERYSQYIAAFNDNDFAGFGKFYAEDVVLELPTRALEGRDAILDFYRAVKARVRETLIVRQCLIDGDALAAEVETEFHALEDWPDFIVRPVKKGDTIRSISFIFYRLRDGKFVHIRSARVRSLL